MKKSKRPMYKGLPLIDATSDLEIEIKKGDVSSAKKKKKDLANCAAANAAKRILKTEVEVHISRLYVKKNNQWIRYETPESVSREITSFDRGAMFEPGEYIFKAPSESRKLGNRTGSNKDKRTSNGSKRHKSRVTMNIRESARN